MPSKVDITNPLAIEREIEIYKPDVVLNAAAKTKTNELEKYENQPEAFRVNVEGPANLMKSARSHGYKLIHYSTGMFFDGAGPKRDGWREEDMPEPISYYTWTKAWADALLEPSCKRDGTLILRLHLPISERTGPKNLFSKLPNFTSALSEAGSMTVLEDLLRSTRHLLEKKATGLFHVVNPGTISLMEIVEIRKVQGLIPKERHVSPTTKNELNALLVSKGAAYQPITTLNSNKLQLEGIQLLEIHIAVGNAIHNLSHS